MEDWATQFKGHPFWSHLTDARDDLRTVMEIEGLSAELVEALERIESVLLLVDRAAQRAEPWLAPIQPLDAASSSLTKVASEVGTFSSDRNVQRLANANSHAGAALVAVQGLPRVDSGEDVEDLLEASVSFRRAIGQHLRYAQEEAEALGDKLGTLNSRFSELQTEVTQQKARLDEAISRYQAQFSQAEDQRRSEFQKLLADEQAAQKGREERFSGEIERLDRKVGQFTSTVEDSLETRLGELEQTIEAKVEAIDSDSAAIVEELQGRLKEAQNIVGAVAQTGSVGGYQKEANWSQVQMWIWQGVTVAGLLAFVGVIFWLPLGDGPAAYSWPLLVQRVLISLAFAGLSGYAAREAARQAEKARRNRRLELEMASVGPFLANLPKERQHALTEAFADRVFGRDGSKLDLTESGPTTNGLLDILRMAVQELIRKS